MKIRFITEIIVSALVLVSVFFSSAFAQKPIKDLKPTVILISLDGFRYDYLEKFKPKTLNELAKGGVRAKWMTPSFPAKTFPNHYTVATGLYPAHHGIIENNVYDFGSVFGLSKRTEVQNSRWWLGEPIWVTAEKQGQIAASYFFPGTEAEIQGIRPTYWREYNGKVPNTLRVDTALSWLDLPPEKRPRVITLYFSDVDDNSHDFSPDSEETRYSVLDVDDAIKRLVDGLKARNVFEKTNLIIVSDHGMAPVDRNNKTFLDDLFDFKKTDRILWTGEIVQIFPKSGEEPGIIKNLQSNIKNAQCWRKSEIPARFHYQDSPRIAPIICLSNEGWVLTSRERYKEWQDNDDLRGMHGAHGYDNALPSMRATFIAHGEVFKKGLVVEPFENIHIYNLMTKILNLKPAKNDGNLTLVNQVLR